MSSHDYFESACAYASKLYKERTSEDFLWILQTVCQRYPQVSLSSLAAEMGSRKSKLTREEQAITGLSYTVGQWGKYAEVVIVPFGDYGRPIDFLPKAPMMICDYFTTQYDSVWLLAWNKDQRLVELQSTIVFDLGASYPDYLQVKSDSFQHKDGIDFLVVRYAPKLTMENRNEKINLVQ
jgi:hypothetical protein